MEGFGFIRDKLDIQILILFILGRLEAGVNLGTLTELTLCDDGISYFAFSECLAELIKTGHVKEKGGLYSITEKGRTNGSITEKELPYSVRHRAEEKTAALAGRQRRNAMIKAEKRPRNDGGFTVNLALHDGLGEILNMELYAVNETQASAMTEAFAQRAEQIYAQVVAVLTEKP